MGPQPAADWFDLFDPQFRADPYPAFHRLRVEDPVHLIAPQVWVLARYADAASALRDRRLNREFGAALELAYGSGASAELQGLVILNREPPAHTKIRSHLAQALPVRPGPELRERIQELVDDLLAPVAAGSEADLIAELAQPLPVLVICRLMGIEPSDSPQLKGWTEAIAPLFDVLVPPAVVERADAAITAFGEYLRPLLEDRRRRPRPDLMSALASGLEQGLTAEELLANAILLFFAGHETTTNLIGNGLLALLRHPDQLARLRDDDRRVEVAIDELLRYDSPGQLTARIAVEDLELGGRTIEKGHVVLVLIGAVNRDPDRFPDPDVLDVDRADAAHLSFGGGHHYCLGAGLARLEAALAIRSVLRRLPDLALRPEPLEWRPTVNLHGLRALPVTFGRG